MRIIGGTLGGRVLRPPMKGWATRPTTDLAREALYNILSNRIDFDTIRMLDLFGGTGAHALECYSRGCEEVIYVERYGKCVQWMKQITSELAIGEDIKIIKSDVKGFVKNHQEQYDFIFADPPYQLKWLSQIPDLIIENDLLTDSGILVLEHDNQHNFENHSAFQEQRKYGQTVFSFFN